VSFLIISLLITHGFNNFQKTPQFQKNRKTVSKK